jgi:deazaflavin-dependent oxidoreductase (nitroreductase family)
MNLSPSTEIRLRRGFKILNRFMLMLWRLGLGRYGNGNKFAGWIMVIKHRGHRTGRTRYAPVNYAEVGDDIYCTAGFGPGTHWYRNLLADPRVELWLPDGRWSGLAEDASQDPQRIAFFRQVLIASGFAGPLFGLNPHRMSDNELESVLEGYRLVRIRKTGPLTGPGGPGELAWIWPLSTFFMLALLLRRRKRV